jgi:copper(I)-binding protein
MFRIFMLCAALCFAPLAASAKDYKQSGLDISNPWARPTAGESKTAAVYFTVKNTGSADDTLKSLSTPVAKKADIHKNTTDEYGVMRMRPVEGGLNVPAGGSVDLNPGGYHVMMTGLKQKLVTGQTVPLTLTFAKAGDVTVDVQIEANPGHNMQGMKGMQGMDHMNMDHMHMHH